MALYPLKVLLDERRNPFIPFITVDAVLVNNSEETLADLLDDRYTKEEVDALLENIDLSDYYTKDEVDQIIENLDLDDYYDKEDVDAIIDNYYTKDEVDNKLSAVYEYKGTVHSYSLLPSSGQKTGDVYNIETADPTHGINAGDNVAWAGNTWDILAGYVDVSGKLDTSKVKSSSSTTSGDVYDVTYINTMLGNVESLLGGI